MTLPDPHQGVLFLFIRDKALLVEARNEPGLPDFTIPGGRCESTDFAAGDYIHAALAREIREELGIKLIAHKIIGTYPFQGYSFHACEITEWQGEIPAHILDTGHPLFWKNYSDFIPNISHGPLRHLLNTHYLPG